MVAGCCILLNPANYLGSFSPCRCAYRTIVLGGGMHLLEANSRLWAILSTLFHNMGVNRYSFSPPKEWGGG
jgi:hypothetical protein